MKFANAALNLFLWTAAARPGSAFSSVFQRSGGSSAPSTYSSYCTSVSVTKRPALIGRRRRSVSCRSSSSLPWWSSSSSAVAAARMMPTTTTCRGGATAASSSATALNAAVAAADTDAKPVEIFRQDYQPLPYTVGTVTMNIDIRPGLTVVTTEMVLKVNDAAAGMENNDMVLDGDETCVAIRSLSVDGVDLVAGTDYELSPGKLVLHKVHDGMTLTVVTEVVPEDNTQLSGLYKSDDMYCTQCEAMGFRRITYYPDRPDNMAVFERVRIEADRADYPLLLSNGNLVDEGDVQDDAQNTGRHYAVWHDPYPKPSYLFATVAGSLGGIHDTYTTSSGRTVQLALYSEPQNVDKLHYAMDALKRSMQWDEDRFGLEYDLDLYNVVAVDNFNMGAMENKSLNVFNTAYVLADEKSATDGDFLRVEAVIGHEYFHNWTGNRVTCRDWFQLTLKEGLTVFRDQEFSGDMGSKAVKRVEDVRGLRARQFTEDAGPMSHPIRPDSYISMDNFYTGTVYVKGAEVIRMYQTILSEAGFRKGMDLYFKRHDGSAVTCDDFLAAMADANNVDLSQFSRWYSTPGTPTVTYSSEFKDGTFSLTLAQSSNSKDGPLHIPVSIGLLDKESGKEVVPTTVLDLKEDKQTFTFDNLNGDVVLSLLRGFSAPVKLVSESGTNDEESMAFLAARDTDGFNRWEAGQNLFTSLIFQTMDGTTSEKTLEYVNEAFGRTLADSDMDFSIQSYALLLPTESTLAEEMDVVDPIGIHKARGSVKKSLARTYEKELRAKYDELTKALEAEKEFKVDAEAIGRRRLRNVLLEYLCSIKESDDEQVAAAELATNHFERAKGMTDKMAGLMALASMDGKGADARDKAMEQFYKDAEGDSLVLNKWFTVQATASLDDVLERTKKLKEHPDFTMLNPNRCRSLVGAYASNSAAFHDEAGESYKFMGEILAELDALNPQISSRLAGCLINWKRYDTARGLKMKAELEKLASMKLSDDLFEIVSRGLKE